MKKQVHGNREMPSTVEKSEILGARAGAGPALPGPTLWRRLPMNGAFLCRVIGCVRLRGRVLDLDCGRVEGARWERTLSLEELRVFSRQVWPERRPGQQEQSCDSVS